MTRGASTFVVVDVCGMRLRVWLCDGYLTVFEWDADEQRWAWAANGIWNRGAHLGAGETIGRGHADTEEALRAIEHALRGEMRRSA